MLFIRGEKAIRDLKYDILRHPNISQTTDGNEQAYIHGTTRKAIASVVVELKNDNDEFEKVQELENDCDYVVLSNEEVINYLNEEEEENENKENSE